jgi:hypothetical protein
MASAIGQADLVFDFIPPGKDPTLIKVYRQECATTHLIIDGQHAMHRRIQGTNIGRQLFSARKKIQLIFRVSSTGWVLTSRKSDSSQNSETTLLFQNYFAIESPSWGFDQ